MCISSGVRSLPGVAQLPWRRRKPEEHRPPALSASRPLRALRAPRRPAGTPLWRREAPAAERAPGAALVRGLRASPPPPPPSHPSCGGARPPRRFCTNKGGPRGAGVAPPAVRPAAAASPSRRPRSGPPPGVARQLASASGPRRVSGAGRDGAGAGAGARPIHEHKDGPGRPGQCPACCGSRHRPAGRQTKAEAVAAPGSPHRRVVPARGRRVHDSVLFGAGPAGLPGARPALRCEGDGGLWAPNSVEIAGTRPHGCLPGRCLVFPIVVKLLPPEPLHGGKSSASPFVYTHINILLLFRALRGALFWGRC